MVEPEPGLREREGEHTSPRAVIGKQRDTQGYSVSRNLCDRDKSKKDPRETDRALNRFLPPSQASLLALLALFLLHSYLLSVT